MSINISSSEALIEKLQGCPCCGAGQQKSLGAPKTWIGAEHFESIKEHLELAKCAECGLVFTNPRPAEHLLLNFYNQPGYECHELHFDDAQVSDAHARFEIIEQFGRKNLLLDFGCGAGQMLRAGKERGWNRTVGVEPGEGARSSLRREGFDVYRDLAEARDLRGQVDAITMNHVLEHLLNPAAVLSGIGELLRPDGIFLVEVPNAGSLRAYIAGSALSSFFSRENQRYQAFPIHLYHFNARQFGAFLKRHGFQIVELRTVGMGIEELWARPPRTNSNSAKPSSAKLSLDKSAAPRSSVPLPLKQSIKAAMSYLHLGEHLLAVCKKS